MRKLSAILCTLLMGACTGMPAGVAPVQNFDADRYLGTWYEIARLDHRFETGLDHVTATYSMNEDGTIKVINKGRDISSGKTETAEGRAKFVQDETTGHLKVSFFGPFYGSYIIFELDQDDYSYSFVSGPDTSYLWLLSRSPTVSDDLIAHFKARANELGFDTDQLIFVNQD